MNALRNLVKARELPVFLALVLVVGIAGIANPGFISATGARDILLGVAIVAILAVGQTFVIVMRHIDLSVGSLIGFTSFLIGDLYSQGYGLWGGLAAALGVGMLVGGINGFLVAYLRLPSLVVTLGGLYVVRGIFNDYAFGRTITAAMVPPEVAWIGLNRLGGIPVLFLIGLVLVIVSGFIMRRVRAARDLYAIGSNPAAAELAGIPVARRVFTAFVINGSIAGLAGAVMLGRFNAANANSGLALELVVIAACVVGGVTIAGGSGSVWGAFLGAILLQAITRAIGALGIPQFWQQAFNGALIILAIAFDKYLSTRVKTTTIMGSDDA
jgi:rhamnose transport system permease protein